jgi:hypothetical protein
MSIYKLLSSRFFNPTTPATTLHSTPFMQIRSFIDDRMLEAIKRTPSGYASIDAFRIQGPNDCVGNSARMQASIKDKLVAERVLEKAQKEATARAWMKLWGMGACAKEQQRIEFPTVDQIVELCASHPPVFMCMQALIPEEQGRYGYPLHHAAVMLFTFKVDGEDIAVVLDGNHLQSNPAMTEIENYLHDLGGDRTPASLTEQDWANINERIRRKRAKDGLGTLKDVKQMGYRFLHLPTLVAASNDKYWGLKTNPLLRALAYDKTEHDSQYQPNYVEADTTHKVCVEMLPLDVENELIEAVRQSPHLIERFDG